MKAKKTFFLKPIVAAILLIFSLAQAKKADFVAFSYNRPIQLYALLESVEAFIKGLEEVHVIYRSTNEDFEDAYQIVKQTFPSVIFHKQGSNPKKDFKPLTLKSSFDSPSQYILFAVDDIIVKDFIDIQACVELLEATNAYGFYLRLGLNLDWCYPFNRSQQVPSVELVADDVYAWSLRSGQYDWGYPNTVDMTLYKKSDVKNNFAAMHYSAPNSLEATWSRRRNTHKKAGLCHAETKIVNLPLNRVQNECQNRHMDAFSAQELLEIFKDGYKIDILALFQIKNRSAHMDYEPTFIKR